MSLTKTIILKSDMNCNLRCKYCYEFNRNGTAYNYASISSQDLSAFIERVARLFPDSKILWMLHGGEPLINGLDYFKNFISCIRRMIRQYPVDFKIALQTNATLLTDDWIAVLEENADLLSARIVSISIDGPQEFNDLVRVTPSGGSSYQKVMDAINRVRNSSLVFTTISVIGSHNVNHPDEVYRYFRDLNPNLCKFIPCYNHDSQGNPELYGINPIEYAKFMCRIFDLWMHDLPTFKKDEWFVIDPIATVVSKLSNSFVTWCEYRPEKCDNFVCMYPDGELWLCDSYNHDTMRDNAFLGNLFTMSDDELVSALSTPCECCSYKDFYRDVTQMCKNCSISKYCCSGCLPYRWELRSKSEKLFSDYCAAKHILIQHIQGGVQRALSQP